ncbi:MAG: hypothetical protein DMD60_02495 [Gemmatimonadetes bacterium]|nr:MAG: hypothetical protein DMD60_02495 [Gemmatimonadota bacterium]
MILTGNTLAGTLKFRDGYKTAADISFSRERSWRAFRTCCTEHCHDESDGQFVQCSMEARHVVAEEVHWVAFLRYLRDPA